nr:hypothetical protein [Endozoicomonas sp.]
MRRAKSTGAVTHNSTSSQQHATTNKAKQPYHSRSISLTEGQPMSSGSQPASPLSQTNLPLVKTVSQLDLSVVNSGIEANTEAWTGYGTSSPVPVAEQYYIPVDLSFIGEDKQQVKLNDANLQMLTVNDCFSQLQKYPHSPELVERHLSQFKTDLCREGVNLTIIKRNECNKEVYSSQKAYSELKLEKTDADFNDTMTRNFLDMAETELPGIAKILPLFCRQDLMSEHFTSLKKLTGINLTHSGKGGSGYHQQLTILNNQQCTLTAKTIYNERVDNTKSKPKKRPVDESGITIHIDFNNKNGTEWVPERVHLKYTCGVPESQWIDNKKPRNTKTLVTTKPPLTRRKKTTTIIPRSRSMEALNTCRIDAMPKIEKSLDQNTRIFRDQLCLTNLNPFDFHGRRALQVKSTVTQFKNKLVKPMMAAQYADKPGETNKLPWGSEISTRLTHLKKYDPLGPHFENEFQKLISKNQIENEEHIKQIRTQCIEAWDSIFAFAVSTYCAHSFNKDFIEQDQSTQAHSVTINEIKLQDMHQLIIFSNKIFKSNENLRKSVNKLKGLDEYLKPNQQEINYKKVIKKIAKLRRNIVNYVKVYREPEVTISDQAKRDFSKYKNTFLATINHDSTSGSQLCDILIRRTLHAARQGFSDEEMADISNRIENMQPGEEGRKGYNELKALLEKKTVSLV